MIRIYYAPANVCYPLKLEDLACNHDHDNTKHNIVLKLSTMHCLELWCNSCLKTVSISVDFFFVEGIMIIE